MPQIKITTKDREVIQKFLSEDIGPKPEDTGNSLIQILEEIWPEAKGDVTFTLVEALQVINECAIQFEVNYADEYVSNGVKFSPNKEEKESAVEALGIFLKKRFPTKDVSGWIVPHKNTVFKMF